MNLADVSQFNEFVRVQRPKILGFLVARGLSPETAEEIANDALTNAHFRFHQFRGTSTVKTWVFRIAQHLAINRYHHERRRGQGRHLPIDAAVNPELPGTYAEVIPDCCEGVAGGAERHELEVLIAAARSRLKPWHVEILTARIEHGLSYEEISVAIGLNVGTVKSRLARAREELLALLPAEAVD